MFGSLISKLRRAWAALVVLAVAAGVLGYAIHEELQARESRAVDLAQLRDELGAQRARLIADFALLRRHASELAGRESVIGALADSADAGIVWEEDLAAVLQSFLDARPGIRWVSVLLEREGTLDLFGARRNREGSVRASGPDLAATWSGEPIRSARQGVGALLSGIVRERNPQSGETVPAIHAAAPIRIEPEFGQAVLVVSLDLVPVLASFTTDDGARQSEIVLTDAGEVVWSSGAAPPSVSRRLALLAGRLRSQAAEELGHSSKLAYGVRFPVSESRPGFALTLVRGTNESAGIGAGDTPSARATLLAAAIGTLFLIGSFARRWLVRRRSEKAGAGHAGGSEDAPISLELLETDPRELLSQVVECLGESRAATRKELTVRCRRNVPERVAIYGSWLGPLVLQLGRNALEAPGDDPVRVSLSCASDEGGRALSVDVEGPLGGLAREPDGEIHLRGAARPWLGLRVVEGMNGDLEIEDAPDAAARVRLRVPLDSVDAV